MDGSHKESSLAENVNGTDYQTFNNDLQDEEKGKEGLSLFEILVYLYIQSMIYYYV